MTRLAEDRTRSEGRRVARVEAARRRRDRRAAIRRVPWWKRLEPRVIVSLMAIGVLCVGSSAYLVRMTVRYFEFLGDTEVATAEAVLEHAQPFYTELVEAKREAFRARAEALALHVDQAYRDSGDAGLRSRAALVLRARMEQHPDLLAIELEGGELESPLRLEQPGSSPEWVHVDSTVRVGAQRPGEAGWGTLQVTFGVDPAIDARYQELGELARRIDVVAVDSGAPVQREEVRRAVISAISVASVLVLMVAFIAGFILARQTTRRVSDISIVMRRIASGDREARAPALGDDEIGVLARDLNGMLDQLDLARRRVEYMQRIGAWQGMARRLAHEIKNPLTPIQLAVQQLRDKDPGTDDAYSRLIRLSAEIVEDEIAGLRRMVTSFSQFARVPEVRLEPVDLRRVVREFERAYGHLGDQGEEGLDDGHEAEVLEVELPDAELPVDGDRQLLKQVLVNLVENAVLSAREAGVSAPRVRVSARRDGDAVLLRVEDNGPGIESERRDRVFEPYETTREHGTGLGLAIVKKVVLDHGGEIRVDDSAIGGAALEIRLPVRA